MDIKRVRDYMKMSQREFAEFWGINIDTLQNWEQGRCRPTGPARVLLFIADRNRLQMTFLSYTQCNLVNIIAGIEAVNQKVRLVDSDLTLFGKRCPDRRIC